MTLVVKVVIALIIMTLVVYLIRLIFARGGNAVDRSLREALDDPWESKALRENPHFDLWQQEVDKP